jgi:hypothetical protein
LPLFYPLFGAPKCNPLKNRERDRVSALDGHLLVGQHNNQPKVGICSRRDMGRVHDLGGTCGADAVLLFGAVN